MMNGGLDRDQSESLAYPETGLWLFSLIFVGSFTERPGKITS